MNAQLVDNLQNPNANSQAIVYIQAHETLQDPMERKMLIAFMIPFLTTLLVLLIAGISNWCNTGRIL